MENKSKTVYRTILIPLLVIVILEIIVLVGSYYFLGTNQQLNKNAQDILYQQTENRKEYLQNDMISNWSNLTPIAQKINNKTEELIDEGKISLDQLDSSSKASTPLLLDISKELISTLYSKEATGIFVLLNTHDLNQDTSNKPGLYIRNEDPKTTSVREYGDLLLERAPIEVVRSLNISTDISWSTMFKINNVVNSDFITKPYNLAYHDKDKLQASEYGYWSEKAYKLAGDNQTAIAYTMPLILDDGTVYGVIGIEILTSYLEELIPFQELRNDDMASYLLCIEHNDEYQPVMLSSNTLTTNMLKDIDVTKNNIKLNNTRYYAVEQEMEIYDEKSPFAEEKWKLISLVPKRNLYSFSNHILLQQLYLAVFMGIMSVVGILYVSKKISGPITRLSKEVSSQPGKSMITALSPTGITEIDQFSNEITQLSKEVLETSTKFLNIINMASIDIGGYEIKKDSVYVTDNFFRLLGLDDVRKPINIEYFYVLIDRIERKYKYTVHDNQKIYRIVGEHGKRYISLKTRKYNDREIGIVEDITANILERKRLEHERDYDILTGLYNRFSFQKRISKVLNKSDNVKKAALVMLDLDNLKAINDNFGHDWGDRFIEHAGRCFKENVPENTICARVSGDEFYLFLYGYDSGDEIRDILANLLAKIHEKVIVLPNGEHISLSASVGVAWYRDNTTDIELLKKYADFAMYQAKKYHRGNIQEFKQELYDEQIMYLKMRSEFLTLIDNQYINYHYQPIINAKTGKIIAYEALMRSQLETLKNPQTILQIAREEDKLVELERICIFNATEQFDNLCKQNLIEEGTMLFINSISSIVMDEKSRKEYHQRFKHLQDRIVIELTEEDSLSEEATRIKREMNGFSGMFALDDYGSGYNTEINLINLDPKFIKVDLSIIRDIDNDFDKQQIVSNIVDFAHKKDAFIIAEGIETEAELLKILELDVDYLQGYYLSMPQSNPQHVSQEAISKIDNYWKD